MPSRPLELAGLADRLGASLDSAGVNVDLAPVADVVPAGTEQANPPIGVFDRQYGSTPDVVVAAAGTVIGGLAAHGVTATLKHFPGLGRVQQNTDTTAHVVDGTTTAADDQVAAFGSLAHSPAHPFVMVSSAIYTRIDPATRGRLLPPRAHRPAAPAARVHRRDHHRRHRQRKGRPGGAPGRARGPVPGRRRHARAHRRPAPVPQMIDAVLARSDSDPAFAAHVDAALHTALLAKARAGLLGG